MAALVPHLQVDLLSLPSSVAWKLLLLDSHFTGELFSYCIFFPNGTVILWIVNLAGGPVLLIKMGQMILISQQAVFGSSMPVVVILTTGIWKEICPVGAPDCRLLHFLMIWRFVIQGQPMRSIRDSRMTVAQFYAVMVLLYDATIPLHPVSSFVRSCWPPPAVRSPPAMGPQAVIFWFSHTAELNNRCVIPNFALRLLYYLQFKGRRYHSLVPPTTVCWQWSETSLPPVSWVRP